MEAGKWKNRGLWGATAIAAILLVVVSYFLVTHQSIEEQLSAIDAARAISDSENAATIYNELLAGDEQIPMCPDFLNESQDQVVSMRPWTSKEYPELAEWIALHKRTIARLIEAAELLKCRFPINGQSDGHTAARRNRLWAMSAWANLLVRAANNDIGEGRTDEALCKYLCVTQLGKHICQQPVLLEYLCGTQIQNMGIQGLISYVILTDPNCTHLKTIELLPLEIKNDWVTSSKDMIEVECLFSRKTKPVLTCLKCWMAGESLEDILQRYSEIYLHAVAQRRALKIVVALECYRSEHGYWPHTLDEVKALAPAEAFTDPVNDNSFVYKNYGNAFKLYSNGKNGIDEDGQYIAVTDPKSVEVAVRKDDILFWPPMIPQN